MSYKQHHVWYLVPAWGHITSANALMHRMLQLNPSLLITVVIHASILDKIEADQAQYTDLARDRLRILPAGDKVPDPSKGNPMMVAVHDTNALYLSTLTTLCTPSSPLPHPTALILDVYGGNLILPLAKEIVGPEVKTFMHVTQGASAMYAYFAPFSHSGFSDYEDAVDRIYGDEKLRKGRGRQEIVEAVVIAKNGTDAVNGTVFRVPGVKDMYDYEREGSNIPTPPGMASMLAEMVKLAANTTGVLISSSHVLEGAALSAWKEFGNPYPHGIQVAPFAWEKGHIIEEDNVRTFLDKHARNEVLYISFGSHFFPVSAPGQVQALLDTLLELDFPFIFALGGQMAKGAISEETIERINTSGKGWIQNSWVDQRGILQHPATGWFLTHGGWNSVSESLAQGVPMVCWPMSHGDQFMDSALLSTRDEPLAFELLQIRMNSAQQPPRRGGGPISGDIEDVKKEFRDVFTKAKGPEGEILRRNAEEVAKQLKIERDGGADEVIRELAEI